MTCANDAPCVGLADCAATCTTDLCIDSCIDTYADGQSAIAPVISCAYSTCQTPCLVAASAGGGG
jgi:hypothetical protein